MDAQHAESQELAAVCEMLCEQGVILHGSPYDPGVSEVHVDPGELEDGSLSRLARTGFLSRVSREFTPYLRQRIVLECRPQHRDAAVHHILRELGVELDQSGRAASAREV